MKPYACVCEICVYSDHACVYLWADSKLRYRKYSVYKFNKRSLNQTIWWCQAVSVFVYFWLSVRIAANALKYHRCTTPPETIYSIVPKSFRGQYLCTGSSGRGVPGRSTVCNPVHKFHYRPKPSCEWLQTKRPRARNAFDVNQQIDSRVYIPFSLL